MKSQLQSHVICMLSLALLGCGGVNVKVEGSFPDPVVAQLPLHMGVYYTEQFREFSYEEKEEGRMEVAVELGASQKKLFDTLFKGYFAELVVLEKMPEGEAVSTISGILVPEIEEFQFATPNITKSNIYEVWIKYKINLYHPDGTPIANWTIPAYGKTPKRFMKSPTIALHQAAIVALRDAGAHFATRFDRLPVVEEWLQTQISLTNSAR